MLVDIDTVYITSNRDNYIAYLLLFVLQTVFRTVICGTVCVILILLFKLLISNFVLIVI